MAKDLHCPNCGATCVPKEDGSLVCPKCGGTFTYKDGEGRLVNVGEYDQLKGKVEQLESGQAELRALLGQPRDPPEEPSESAEPQDPQIEDEDDDEEDW